MEKCGLISAPCTSRTSEPDYQTTVLLREAQKDNSSLSESFAACQEEVSQLKQQQHHHHQQNHAAAEAQRLCGEITCLNDKILYATSATVATAV